jgi:hypothetical protein
VAGVRGQFAIIVAIAASPPRAYKNGCLQTLGVQMRCLPALLFAYEVMHLRSRQARLNPQTVWLKSASLLHSFDPCSRPLGLLHLARRSAGRYPLINRGPPLIEHAAVVIAAAMVALIVHTA